MTFRTKLLLITILPVILISLAALVLIDYQSRNLAREQGLAVEQMIRNSKEAELENYIKLARTAVKPFYDWNEVSILQAQKQVANVILQMNYGDDGYFFIAREGGHSLNNPILLEEIGKQKLDLLASEVGSIPGIVEHIDNNVFTPHRYKWNKPSTGTPAEKISSAVSLDRWNWVVGSGLYMDDIAAQIRAIQLQLETNVRQTRWVLVGLAVGAVLLTSLLFAFVRFSEQRFADVRLKELASEIVHAQENERKRVSTELHDGISQLLVSARYGLDIAAANSKGKKLVSEPLEKSMQTISTAISEIRRISMALRPSVLDDMGLAAAIKSLGSDFETQTKIQAIVETSNVGHILDDREKTTMYRVAQEALANVVKHSNATKVWIELTCSNSKVALTIADNGNGFSQTSERFQEKGLGMRNMQERIESHGGIMKIGTGKGGGLSLQFKLDKAGLKEINKVVEAA